MGRKGWPWSGGMGIINRLFDLFVGPWRSLVAHYSGGIGVAGSNPVGPTSKKPQGILYPLRFFCLPSGFEPMERPESDATIRSIRLRGVKAGCLDEWNSPKIRYTFFKRFRHFVYMRKLRPRGPEACLGVVHWNSPKIRYTFFKRFRHFVYTPSDLKNQEKNASSFYCTKPQYTQKQETSTLPSSNIDTYKSTPF